ncbi:hypothetical protein D3H55_16985 [Bacillus salacetis]|uniref:Uncharacterized protein n=1 Tax=Bacillus salacetis TaxID=2315464 RepID=A0A3A1QXG3_9BACI|nr:hypothetical protein [Bacillus salacetis]RIW30429.1 hypothetical protein D3H55_16985 [Bacillus salacetis]
MKISISSPCIVFKDVCVHEVENNSGIFLGKNHQYGWRSTETEYCGFGGVSGRKNRVINSTHLVLKERAANPDFDGGKSG